MRHLHTIDGLNAIPQKGKRIVALQFDDKRHITKSGHRLRKVICRCYCGKVFSMLILSFVAGQCMSCGCKTERQKYLYKLAGDNKKLMNVYSTMITRCCNKEAINYSGYGAKGVIVCAEWLDDRGKFVEWALANGYKDGLQLDKDIRGNGKLYSPDTCCFVDALTNLSNRHCSVKYNYQGQRLTLSQIARLVNIRYQCLKARVYGQNKSLEEAIAMGSPRTLYRSSSKPTA